MSVLTLEPSFKVKRGEPNLKVLITRLLLAGSWAGYLLGVVGFYLRPLRQGQTRIATLKSAYNLLIIGPRCLGC